MTLIRSTGLTPFTYSGAPMRLVGAVQAGEVDGRSIFTTTNTAKIFTCSPTGQLLTFTPGNAFSGFNRLENGGTYLAQGKQAFEFANGFPLADGAAQSQALAVIRTAIANAGGNSPSPSPTPFNPLPQYASTAQIGQNIGFPPDWEGSYTVNRFYSAREPISVTNGQFGVGTLQRDSKGFVTSLGTGQVYRSPIAIEDAKSQLRTGRWIFKWSGDRQNSTVRLSGGTLNYTTAIGATEHRATFDWNGNDIWLEVDQVATNYPKNFSLVHQDFESTPDAFDPWFLARCKFKYLRFMDWGHTNWGRGGDGNRSSQWSDRTTPQHFSQNYKNGACWEIAINLCNQVQANPHFCVPFAYTEASIRSFLELLKSSVNPSLKIFLEWGNEIWNLGTFEHGQWCAAQARSLGLVPANEPDWSAGWTYQAYKVSEVGRLIDEVFTGADRDRIVHVVGSQAGSGNAYIADFILQYQRSDYPQPTHAYADGITIAPYFTGILNKAENYSAALSMTDAQRFQAMRDDINGDVKQQIKWHVDLIKTKYPNLILTAYESGQHFTPLDGNTQIEQLFYDLNQHSDMQTIYQEYYQLWNQETGNYPIFHFNFYGRWSRFGYWSSIRKLNSSLTTEPKARALYSQAGINTSSFVEVTL